MVGRFLDENLSSFLFDPGQREYQFHKDNSVYHLLKGRYDDETDFLYILYADREDNPYEDHRNTDIIGVALHPADRGDCPFQVYQGAEYAGIISYPTRKVYCVGKEAGRYMERAANLHMLVTEAEAAISERVKQIVNDQPVPVSDEAEEVYQAEADRECWLEYEADKEAYAAFYERKEPAYIPSFSLRPLNTAMIVSLINHHDDTIARQAEKFVLRQANYINHRLWKIGVIQERLAALEAKAGAHHMLRAIGESIGNEKMVTLHVEKKGIQMTVEIGAMIIEQMDNPDYGIEYMDGPSRRAFQAAYGKRAKLRAGDIMKITHAGRTLYVKGASTPNNI